jgi:hypothetical protein
MFITPSVCSWVDLKVEGCEFSTASFQNVYALSIRPLTRALYTASFIFISCLPISGLFEMLAKQADVCLIVKY